MDARIQSALLAGIVSLALALAMLLRRNRTRLWTTFAFLNLSLFLYQLGDFLLGVLAHKAVWPSRLTLAAAGFIPAAVLEFLVAFQGDSGGRAVALRRLAVSCSALMVALALSPLAPLPWVRVAAASVIFLLLTAAVSLLYARMRRAAGPTPPPRPLLSLAGAAPLVRLHIGEPLLRL